VVALFTTDPEVGPIATRGLRIISAGFPFYAAGYVLTQSFNGAGDTVTPTLINLGCFWAFEIPLAYVLGRPLGFGPDGVFWAMAIAFSAMSVVSALLFRRGRWKLKRV
jgi:Na+-driven multidrug efflux pump